MLYLCACHELKIEKPKVMSISPKMSLNTLGSYLWAWLAYVRYSRALLGFGAFIEAQHGALALVSLDILTEHSPQPPSKIFI